MVVTAGIPKSQQDRAIQAINSFFLSGLILDLMAAVLALLTARWLQRLTPDEKVFLERTFAAVKLPIAFGTVYSTNVTVGDGVGAGCRIANIVSYDALALALQRATVHG